MTTEADLKKHYNFQLEYYTPIRQATIDTVLDLLKIRLEGEVLDVGCGTGWFVHWVNNNTDAIAIGVDYAIERVKIANARSEWPCCTVGAVYEALENTSPVDIITFWDVLEHLERPREAVDLAKHKADDVYASIPINSAYKAHLQVWKDVPSIVTDLDPDRIVVWSDSLDYFLCHWKGA